MRWPWTRRRSAWEVLWGFPLRRKPNVHPEKGLKFR